MAEAPFLERRPAGEAGIGSQDICEFRAGSDPLADLQEDIFPITDNGKVEAVPGKGFLRVDA